MIWILWVNQGPTLKIGANLVGPFVEGPSKGIRFVAGWAMKKTLKDFSKNSTALSGGLRELKLGQNECGRKFIFRFLFFDGPHFAAKFCPERAHRCRPALLSYQPSRPLPGQAGSVRGNRAAVENEHRTVRVRPALCCQSKPPDYRSLTPKP